MRENQGRILQVQINLADPAVSWAADRLRDEGFFLGGHLPVWRGTDDLMLQHLPRRPRWDAVQVLPGPGRATLDLVRADRERVRGKAG